MSHGKSLKTTSELIAEMSANLQPTRSVDGVFAFALKWLLLSAVAVSLWLALVPTPLGLAAKLQRPWFFADTTLWFLATALPALVVYFGRKPGRKIRGLTWLASSAVALVPLTLLLRLASSNLAEPLLTEMSWYRGRCGPLILMMGASWAAALYWWVRKGAPTRLRQQGLWIGLSAGALGSLAMELICAHENPLHLLIWHVTPIVLLTVLSIAFARRGLRW